MPQRAVHQISLAVALRQGRWRPEHAKVVVSAWHKSGLSMSDFARNHGLSFDRLNHWAQKFHQDQIKRHTEKPSFMPVQIVGQKPVISQTPKTTAKDAMDIILPTGIKVAVYPGFDSVEVKRLVELLEC